MAGIDTGHCFSLYKPPGYVEFDTVGTQEDDLNMTYECGLCPTRPTFTSPWDLWDHNVDVHPELIPEEDEPEADRYEDDDLAYWVNREIEEYNLGRPLFPNEY